MPPVWPPPRPRVQRDEVLALQRKLARQLDGLQTAMNLRFNIFHEELALMRAAALDEPERIIIPPPLPRWSPLQMAALALAIVLAAGVGSLLTLLVEPYAAWLRGLAWP